MIVGFEKSVGRISRHKYTVILLGTTSLNASFFFRINICVRWVYSLKLTGGSRILNESVVFFSSPSCLSIFILIPNLKCDFADRGVIFEQLI